jgi:hypothetical protein
MNKLVKSLKRCLCEKPGSPESEGETQDDGVRETLIQEVCDELDELCKGKEEEGGVWTAKERSKWRKLSKKLVTLGYWVEDARKDTPWTTIAVSKPVEKKETKAKPEKKTK